MADYTLEFNDALRASLCQICRLCGLNNPEKVQIISNKLKGKQSKLAPLDQKIQELIGIRVTKNDKMPQQMCKECEEKINDFHEFREICYETDAKTRELLGLKIEPCVQLDNSVNSKRGRKRKAGECYKNSDFLLEPKLEDEIETPQKRQILQRKERKLDPTYRPQKPAGSKMSCNICGHNFRKPALMMSHKRLMHRPTVDRYYCFDCDDRFREPGDLREHFNWHEAANQPITCPLCDAHFKSNELAEQHVQAHNAELATPELAKPCICPLCGGSYATNLLFNLHYCVSDRLACGGCALQLFNTLDYKKHVTRCAEAFRTAADVLSFEQGDPYASYLDDNAHCRGAKVEEENMRLADKLLRSAQDTLESIKNEHDRSLDGQPNEYLVEAHYDSDTTVSLDESAIEAEAEEMSRLTPAGNYAMREDSPHVVPKLKIKLEHGVLNSTIVHSKNTAPKNTQDKAPNITSSSSSHEDSNDPPSAVAVAVEVKQENLDLDTSGAMLSGKPLFMTSIPKGHFDYTNSEHLNETIEDAKPSHAELGSIFDPVHIARRAEEAAESAVIKQEPAEHCDNAEELTANIHIKEEPMTEELCENESIALTIKKELPTHEEISARIKAELLADVTTDILDTESERVESSTVNAFYRHSGNFELKVEPEDASILESIAIKKEICNADYEEAHTTRRVFKQTRIPVIKMEPVEFRALGLHLKRKPKRVIANTGLAITIKRELQPLDESLPAAVVEQSESYEDQRPSTSTEAALIANSSESYNHSEAVKSASSTRAETIESVQNSVDKSGDESFKTEYNELVKYEPSEIAIDVNQQASTQSSKDNLTMLVNPICSESTLHVALRWNEPSSPDNNESTPIDAQAPCSSDMLTSISNEEQQNVINDEILTSYAGVNTLNREELENRSNEWQLEQQLRARDEARLEHLEHIGLISAENINEIAENNNNSNIERQMEMDNQAQFDIHDADN